MSYDPFDKIAGKIANIQAIQPAGRVIMEPGYTHFPLAPENFQEIPQVDTHHKIAYLDGGNNEVLGGAGFSIQFNRVYYCVFQGKNRIQTKIIPELIEYYSVTLATATRTSIKYTTTLIPVDPNHASFLPQDDHLEFDSFDPAIRNGNARANIGNMANIARRFAEWKLAGLITEHELVEHDMVVMDGTLNTGYPNERHYAQVTFEITLNKKIILSGLAKQSHVYTDTGMPLIPSVLYNAKNIEFEKWFIPIAEGRPDVHRARIFVARLHRLATTPYRFEVATPHIHESVQSIPSIFGQLAHNCTDATFPGYPYGLIDADHRSRVRFDELEHHKLRIINKIADNPEILEKIAAETGAIDSHEILNSLI